MGTARSVLFTVSSIAMICTGVLSLITAALMINDRINTANTSVTFTVITSSVVAVYSIINIISGIAGAKKYNRRIISSVIITLPQISIIICILSLVLSFINGIRIGHTILLLLSGIAIPLLFIFASIKKSNLQ